MYLTSISLSYFFLTVGILSAALYVYFKVLVVKTNPQRDSRHKILGDMKDPDSWIQRNKRMCYLSLFWAVVSILLFAILKFSYPMKLISTMYLIIYTIIVILSIAFFARAKNKVSA